MRRGTAVATAILLAGIGTAWTACTAGSSEVAPGCGLVDPTDVTSLTGTETRSSTTGSITHLRQDGESVSCRTSSTEDTKRYVVVEVERHPEPYELDNRPCNAGWVYAGTPDAYAPACQETDERGSRTMLVARAGDYLVHVTIGRPDRKWAGDPEVALELSDQVAERLR